MQTTDEKTRNFFKKYLRGWQTPSVFSFFLAHDKSCRCSFFDIFIFVFEGSRSISFRKIIEFRSGTYQNSDSVPQLMARFSYWVRRLLM